ncbi:Ig-like domain-containing protein [Virgisporangium aliadipatigenens]|nr:Ig-like domain-containing protein [Virgisporangium aliadipatigenens]
MRKTARKLVMVGVLGGLLALAGCGGGEKGSWYEPGAAPPGTPSPSPVANVTVSAPADGATNVTTATELTLSKADPGVTVAVAGPDGAAVPGALSADGATWVPGAQLKYATAYKVTVTTPQKAEPVTTSFTTMAKPGKTTSVNTPLADGKTYGVALPIVLNFGSAVPQDQRANVEKRLRVTSEPAQLGTWHWFSGTEVHYRPKEYWQSGTKISVRAAIGGLPMGNNAYGSKDLTWNATIGDKIVMVTDDATHHMTVYQNDQEIRQIPISLGKASTPSSSGAMVVMEKNRQEIFKSTDPSDPYEEEVEWTQRLTWGGEYLHSAPWSVGDQGKRNVSHGCTNMSESNATWLWNLTKIGDPVTVKGTPRELKWGNGWTDWNRSWEEYLKGSALPAPAAPAASPSSPAPAN